MTAVFAMIYGKPKLAEPDESDEPTEPNPTEPSKSRSGNAYLDSLKEKP
jgi:hypothetical protein